MRNLLSLMEIDTSQKLNLLARQFRCCHHGFTSLGRNINPDLHINIVSLVWDSISNHLKIGTILCIAYPSCTSSGCLQLNLLFSIPESYTTKSYSLTNNISICTKCQGILLSFGRIPTIIHQFHSTSGLGIHINCTAIIKIKTQSHVSILYSWAMMAHLIILVPDFGHYFRHLKRIRTPKQA